MGRSVSAGGPRTAAVEERSSAASRLPDVARAANDDGRKADSLDGDRGDEALRKRARARQCQPSRRHGKHLRAARRQWIGQVDADPGAGRLSSARRWRRHDSRRGAELQQARRAGESGRAPLRPPGPCAHPRSFHHGQPRARARLCARFRRRHPVAAGGRARAARARKRRRRGVATRTRRPSRAGRSNPGRDRSRPRSSRPFAQHPRARRADRAPAAVGSLEAHRTARGVEGARPADRLRDAPAGRGLQGRRRGDGAARRPGSVQRPVVDARRRRPAGA